MNMVMPSFTAEASLVKTSSRYRSIEGQSHGSGRPDVIPQLLIIQWPSCPPTQDLICEGNGYCYCGNLVSVLHVPIHFGLD
jgi:hypothetical protein